MSVSAQDVEKIAHLARLGLNESDIPVHIRNLTRILDLIDQMATVDTDNIAPMTHSQDVYQPVRPDEITEVDQRELLQQSAPRVELGLYLVPKVLE